MSEEPQVCYCVVRNIPASFHSSDLRTFFSQLIEHKVFLCFHYKHRPEVVKSVEGEKTSSKQTHVCVVKFANQIARQYFIDKYNEINWINKNGDYLEEKCKIFKFSLSNDAEAASVSQLMYQTQSEKKRSRRHASKEFFSANDLLQMSELNPPKNVMPNGNVGTPTSVFQALIQQCAMPSSLIKSLGLKFSNSGSNRRYGNVPFTYENSEVIDKDEEKQVPVYTAHGHLVANMKKTGQMNKTEKENKSFLDEAIQAEEKSDGDAESDSDVDDDTGEEWERHAAFHNDVTSQERTKERLFEEEIELKWEKGGSGLVFYTDAQYWAEEQGDFDEQTTDDWDVDMSIYYGQDGDKDAKDFLRIRKEQRLRSGLNAGVVSKKQVKKIKFTKREIGGFEKYTKGFGRKIMEKLGWNDQQSLGPKNMGLLEPLEAEGQSSREKIGLGYHGEKLNRGANEVNSPQQTDDSSSVRITSVAQRPSRTNLPHRSLHETNFPLHRSVEPHASHSWSFPQFRTNLVSLYDGHKAMTSSQRSRFVPGEDGVAITTIFDQPLDVDTKSGLVRSQHPTALKHRAASRSSTNQPSVSSVIVPVTCGSKLVKHQKQHSNQNVSRDLPELRNRITYLYVPVKFVRPSNPCDHFV